jgi:hypothetical protein
LCYYNLILWLTDVDAAYAAEIDEIKAQAPKRKNNMKKERLKAGEERTRNKR